MSLRLRKLMIGLSTTVVAFFAMVLPTYASSSAVVLNDSMFGDDSQSSYVYVVSHTDLGPVSKGAFYVKGYTSSNCSHVIVDAVNKGAGLKDLNYRLNEYQSGDKAFVYRMKEGWGNLAEGVNYYRFRAFCDGGQVETSYLKFLYDKPASKVTTSDVRSSEKASVVTFKPVNTPTYDSGVSFYTNVDGEKVQSPTYSVTQPSAASAKCSDGTYSFSHSRRGTCSHHGGVAVWY